jgi:hypothetical protein
LTSVCIYSTGVILFGIFARFLFKDSSTTVAAKVIRFILMAMHYCKFLIHFNTADRVNRHHFEHLHISIYIYRSAIIFIIFFEIIALPGVIWDFPYICLSMYSASSIITLQKFPWRSIILFANPKYFRRISNISYQIVLFTNYYYKSSSNNRTVSKILSLIRQKILI